MGLLSEWSEAYDGEDQHFALSYNKRERTGSKLLRMMMRKDKIATTSVVSSSASITACFAGCAVRGSVPATRL